MCFHRPWLFSWFMRSVVGVVVGFLADSPAFLTRFSPPHLIFFSPCGIIWSQENTLKKEIRTHFVVGGGGKVRTRKSGCSFLGVFILFRKVAVGTTWHPRKESQNGKNCTFSWRIRVLNTFWSHHNTKILWVRVYSSFQARDRNLALLW